MGAHAVAGVAGDETILKQQCSRVAGADMKHKRRAFFHAGQVTETAAGLEIDQARHFAIVDRAKAQTAGDADPVHEGFLILCLAENVGDGGACDLVGVEAEFVDGFLEIADD